MERCTLLRPKPCNLLSLLCVKILLLLRLGIVRHEFIMTIITSGVYSRLKMLHSMNASGMCSQASIALSNILQNIVVISLSLRKLIDSLRISVKKRIFFSLQL